MLGLGKKHKKQEKKGEDLGVPMHTIPDIFYGGNDPVIYHGDETPQTVQKNFSSPSSGKGNTSPQKLVRPSQRDTWIHRHKKILLWVGAVVFLLCVTGGATWYYVQQARGQLGSTDIPTQPETTGTVGEVDMQQPLVPLVATTTVSSTTLNVATTTSIENIESVDPVSFPNILLINSEDADADQLTNEEELIFKTNQDIWDTDDDGYYDGQEITNLYNPSGFAPVKLIDSGLVTEYVSPKWQYRVYYPATWQIGTVDTDGRQVLASTLSGDFVEIRVFDRLASQSFQDWFALNIEKETFQDIQSIITRFKEQSYLRRDGLVAYFVGTQTVTVLIYHPGITGAVPYRHVMRMMIESFRPSTSTAILPTQQPLPTPPGTENSTPEAATTSISGNENRITPPQQ
ncbi:MAG: hypothetical protein UV82_C0004G0011 [Candidatus Magasanikbacteria bacterium GW2011_GWD2_43_18]|uniref:Uncharacterized protein n=1 Tax=Candidatus Magasanikbacteria bacterium GW2011_GWE2_42_7 TaxID=1619052 RepID=A0A0G1BFD0_9BACT|nr:MAG: hypothetical protein UV18_C0001G0093 [Candidatus Magasanikbacteria bacterium GW2011_GWC2_42_27]KKS72007.1 MAG: hypothetical protein UV42_C0015G0010 [Candidatus Magasanikbacteria bacterium GW2011_GWE2_42_7]KKT04846.1 MAG: hypothetical protein UV82_C0004G0011 [Candidatus Magasanikbacteria bacterium GW2011_GWD2_43_18]KKT25212.1 MAG: hypothetical protein UW10_C0012G0004 [Candidatus Magasanikbacteria bacterium GW2011_GWA2_43_9]HBB37538.1 hypothetical protein [Candidatus Magasanikbacteria bac